MKKIFYVILSFVFLFVGGSLISTSVFASADDTPTVIEIYDADAFISKFATNPNAFNDSNVVVRLKEDIDFSGVDTESIYQTKNAFMGTFDGNGHTIKNITIKSKISYYGLIPYAVGATVQNLRIAGDIEFVFDQDNQNETYAGIIVGYGENVVIRNCELDNMIIDDSSGEVEVSYDSISVPVYSGLNFGLLAGKLKGNPNATNLLEPANVYNCINYYNLNVSIEKYSYVSVGGLVGFAENCFMQNNINFGDIKYSKNATSENIYKQSFGGIAGLINGDFLNIRNAGFGGQLGTKGDVSGLNAYVGAIFGRASTDSVVKQNINYAYFTQSSLKPSGDEYVARGEFVKAVDNLDKTLLSNQEMFDKSLKLWDFENVWMIVDSKPRIQHFQKFSFGFQDTLDTGLILEESAEMRIAGNASGSATIEGAFGDTIEMHLSIKPEYRGFYYINQNASFILLEHTQFFGDCQVEEVVEDGVLTGYKISITAKATTAGRYSFYVSEKVYNCEVSISEEARANSQGGVYVKKKGSNLEGDPVPQINIPFAYNTEEQQIVAKGEGIYSFAYWQLFYKEASGEFSATPVTFAQENMSTVDVDFGVEPFNKEFKLVAYFTDEQAIKLGFGEYDTEKIKSIIVSQTLYTGEQVQIAPTDVVQFEITTQKDFVLDYEKIEEEIIILYGDTLSPYPAREKEPFKNEDGTTTYYFQIDLKFAKDNIKGNAIAIQLEASQDAGNNTNGILWIIIVAVAVAVVGIVIVVIYVLRRRGGGGKSGGKSKGKEEKQTYKDYYI